MSLAGVFNVPVDEEHLLRWAFTNADLHTRIQQAVFSQTSGAVLLTPYILDPIPTFDEESWLARHQTAHDDFNDLLGIQGSDLSTVDFKNREELEVWIRLHAVEHQAANQILGI